MRGLHRMLLRGAANGSSVGIVLTLPTTYCLLPTAYYVLAVLRSGWPVAGETADRARADGGPPGRVPRRGVVRATAACGAGAVRFRAAADRHCGGSSTGRLAVGTDAKES